VVREPGRAFEYSGGGTTIEQLAMEDVTTPGGFADLMRTEVLAPLDMAHSTYAQPLPPSGWANAAVGYRETGRPVDGRAHTYPEQAAAGLWTTPSDLARMLLAVRAVVRGERTDFLPDTLARQILVRQAGGPMGIGFFVNGAGDSLNFGHGGSNEGFRAQATLYLDSGDGAVVMTNSDAGQRLVGEILATVALANGWRGYLSPEVVLQPVPRGTLDRYVGLWRSEKLPPARIARRGDGLTFQIEGDAAVPMVALGPAEFYIAEADARVRFPGAPARVDRMELQLPGLSAVFERRPGR
jgi:CubicO group peptidase (beta-lactamase class C family)